MCEFCEHFICADHTPVTIRDLTVHCHLLFEETEEKLSVQCIQYLSKVWTSFSTTLHFWQKHCSNIFFCPEMACMCVHASAVWRPRYIFCMNAFLCMWVCAWVLVGYVFAWSCACVCEHVCRCSALYASEPVPAGIRKVDLGHKYLISVCCPWKSSIYSWPNGKMPLPDPLPSLTDKKKCNSERR